MTTTRWGEYQGRIEDSRLVTGRGQYISDIHLDRMAYATVVRSQVPSARIVAIDASVALAHPGVLAVYTAADLAADGIVDFSSPGDLPRGGGAKAYPARRPILAATLKPGERTEGWAALSANMSGSKSPSSVRAPK